MCVNLASRQNEIIRANLGPTPVDPDKATEWELGKNQSAAPLTYRDAGLDLDVYEQTIAELAR